MKKFSKFEINEKAKDIPDDETVSEISAILRQHGFPTFVKNINIIETVERVFTAYDKMKAILLANAELYKKIK